MKQHISEDLLTKYLLGEGSPDEAANIEAWIANDSANARKLEEIKIILETSKRLAQVTPIDETEGWERLKSLKEQSKNKKARVVPMRAHLNWIQTAAAVLLFAGGGWMVYYLYHGKSGVSTDWVALKSEKNVLIDTLPDGSVVHINKNSILTYPGNFKSNRQVKLTGEAFFNVKHDDAEPFTVQVDDINVRDIGTAFNIKSRQHHTEIIVESGIVKVSKNKDDVQLNAQQMVSIKTGDRGFRVEKSKDELYNYYIGNTFAANRTPLWRLTEILKEAYAADIRIENKALRNAPITTTIRLQDSLGSVLNLISLTTAGMHVQKAGGTYIIK